MAIWLFGYLAYFASCEPKSKKTTNGFPYLFTLISYLAIWLFGLFHYPKAKKQNPTLLLYYEMLFGYLANWPN